MRRPDRSEKEARTIYQGVLDLGSKALIEKDFPTLMNAMKLPHGFRSPTSEHIIVTKGLDRNARASSRAEFIGSDRICDYHATRFFSRGRVRLGPAKSQMTLQRSGTRWRLKSVTNSLLRKKLPHETVVSSDTLISLREIQKRIRL